MAEQSTLEQKTAKAILQQPIDVVIRDKKYTIAPPSIATLILVSEAVSLLPAIRLDAEKVVEEVLSTAKDCRPIGDILATLILGAKNLTETVEKKQEVQHSALFGLVRWKTVEKITVTVDRKSELASSLLEDLTPQEIYNLFVQALANMQLQDFFGLTTFLTETNLLRPTKVVTEATAFGQ